MRQPHQPNANPLVEQIVQAYLSTHMTDRQFETLIEEAIAAAKGTGTSDDAVKAYDRGFSDGYDSALAEMKS